MLISHFYQTFSKIQPRGCIKNIFVSNALQVTIPTKDFHPFLLWSNNSYIKVSERKEGNERLRYKPWIKIARKRNNFIRKREEKKEREKNNKIFSFSNLLPPHVTS